VAQRLLWQLKLATKAGDVAQDGSGRNGIFTEAFLKNFDLGLPLDQFFIKLRSDVITKTGGQQTPQIQTSGILANFYLGTPRIISSPLPVSQQATPMAVLGTPVSLQNSNGMLVVTSEKNQVDSIILSAIQQSTNTEIQLANTETIILPEGIWTIQARLKNDTENVFNKTVLISAVSPVRISIPYLNFSYNFQKAMLLDERSMLTASYNKKVKLGKIRKTVGWISLGLGATGAGVSVYSFITGKVPSLITRQQLIQKMQIALGQ